MEFFGKLKNLFSGKRRTMNFKPIDKYKFRVGKSNKGKLLDEMTRDELAFTKGRAENLVKYSEYAEYSEGIKYWSSVVAECSKRLFESQS